MHWIAIAALGQAACAAGAAVKPTNHSTANASTVIDDITVISRYWGESNTMHAS